MCDKLEYACCIHNFAYVSYVFHDIDADSFNTTV